MDILQTVLDHYFTYARLEQFREWTRIERRPDDNRVTELAQELAETIRKRLIEPLDKAPCRAGTSLSDAINDFVMKLEAFRYCLIYCEKPTDLVVNRIETSWLELQAEIGRAMALDLEGIRDERKEGGHNSHGLTKQEREERNRRIQAHIDQLCLAKGLSYSAARHVAAKKAGLHPDTLKSFTRNPRPRK